ncbi:hypothetical protein AMTRI_Chr03g43710 [Amborella trichopoda]
MEVVNRSLSFSRLLQLCASDKNLRKGQNIHAQIIKTGFLSDPFLQNSLINTYSKCGDMADAELKFEEIQTKDVVSWNCLISGFCNHSHDSKVLNLFKRMTTENMKPNSFTFSGVITAISGLSALREGRQVHSLSMKTSILNDVYVGSSLINMYCKCGLVSEARLVFEEMPDKNMVTWAAMISGYALERCGHEAIALFKLLQKENMGLNEFIFTGVLSAASAKEFLNYGLQIHSQALKTGLESHISVKNAIVTMYSKCERLTDALLVFESSEEKNPITWSAMITGYTQNGDSSEALRLFSSMNLAGIRPSEFTLVAVLNSCSNLMALWPGIQVHTYLLKMGFGHQLFIRSALIDMYAKCGSIKDARKGFDQLQEADVVLWTSIINGHVQNGENEEALSLYGQMERENIRPNSLTIASVLRACSSLAALEQGKQIHARAVKYGFGLTNPTGSALSTLYSKCGCLEEGNLAFQRIPERDVVSWNTMISGYSHNGFGQKALKLFEEMESEGITPDSVTFVNLLSACSHMGVVERGWHYFKLMKEKYGIEPRVDHYACIVDVLSRKGLLLEARNFIESVPIDHGLALWRILLGACRNQRNFEIGSYAGQRLMELGSTESSAYVLLSSIYASVGRWGDVERVRKLMRERGVAKEPGCSWVELKNRVHVFVVGDQMHPQIGEIRLELKRLNMQMGDEGYRPDTNWVFPDMERGLAQSG